MAQKPRNPSKAEPASDEDEEEIPTLEEAREKGWTSTFLNSTPIGGKHVLWTYAVPTERTATGTIAIVKIIGVHDSEPELEKKAKKELGSQFCKLVRINPTGTWQPIRDPRGMRRDEYEHYDGKGEIKKIVTQQNVDLHNKEKKDEAEMREEMQKVMKESKEDDPESIENFLILTVKIAQLPGLVERYQSEIAKMTKEIVRLHDLKPEYDEKYKEFVKKYPNYPKQAEALKQTYAKS